MIELRYFHGMGLRYIGKITGRNASTIQRRIERAIAKLRRALVPRK
ncbi:MAG: sigma factor-like helix-turn-helix DNA-binding protein [Candidatus Hydrogenedentota bacterium]